MKPLRVLIVTCIAVVLAVLLVIALGLKATGWKLGATPAPVTFVAQVDAGAGHGVSHAEAPKPAKFSCKSRPCFGAIGLIGTVVPQDLKLFQDAIKVTAPAKPDGYVVLINSPGGVWEVGRDIYSLLLNLDVPVHCIVDGSSMSVAFWVLQACDVRVATPTSRFVMHETSMMVTEPTVFHRRDLISRLSEVTALTNIMTTAVAARMGMSKEALARRIDGVDWHMDVTEAISTGALDSVFKGTPQDYLDALRAAPVKRTKHAASP